MLTTITTIKNNVINAPYIKKTPQNTTRTIKRRIATTNVEAKQSIMTHD